jgi:BMFP domain-containing protein YqiC
VSHAEFPRGQAAKDRSELNSLQARIDALEVKLASYRVEAIRPIERMEGKIATEPTQTKVATGGR